MYREKPILEFPRFNLQQHALNFFKLYFESSGLLIKAFAMIPQGFPHTWPTQIPMLFLFAGVHLHAPSVIGEGEEVFYLRRRADGIVQSLQPVLTLLKSRKLTPVPQTNIYR